MSQASRPVPVRLAGRLAVACGAVLVAWLCGLAWFAYQAERRMPPPPNADGIVVLTGGAERVATALRLLADGRGNLLLISGVGGEAELGDFARLAGVDPRALTSRVTLGRAAASTRGNAAETAAWAHANRLRSLVVVTASYHMPRALLELGRALPEVTLHAAPVRPPALDHTPDWATLRLLAAEYSKWLLACAGMSRFGDWHEDGLHA